MCALPAASNDYAALDVTQPFRPPHPLDFEPEVFTPAPKERHNGTLRAALAAWGPVPEPHGPVGIVWPAEMLAWEPSVATASPAAPVPVTVRPPGAHCRGRMDYGLSEQADMVAARQAQFPPVQRSAKMPAQEPWFLAAAAKLTQALPSVPPPPQAMRAPASRLSAECQVALAEAAAAVVPYVEPTELKPVYGQLVVATELAHVQKASFPPPPPMLPAGLDMGERLSKKAVGGRMGQVETAGSYGHSQGQCKPCVFWHKGVCFKKSDCGFCHLKHEDERVRQVRPSKSTRQCLQRRDEQRKIDLERRRAKKSLAVEAAVTAATTAAAAIAAGY
eukprot:CAMPEP_0179069196 /NCGR_PEP_ID=MMETSP0796-20121207/30385_1 /TAXON_ID=73915 /ORGANISM="Pyrodinium bahamense, Strain pbaha01" /LENGTH=332 /DNA_ID=CAMNT_0020766259 /DNA_START=110 /DNA_END=1108 /DNA_ORIENTATION=+